MFYCNQLKVLAKNIWPKLYSRVQITNCNTISEVLGNELARRVQRNASYSLRAFARDLKLSPSRLSEVLKGRNGLSETSLNSIAKNLTKRTREQDYIRDIVLAEFARNKNVRELAKKRAQAIREAEAHRKLQADEFAAISQWYHGAILELMQVQGFRSDPAWMASRLGVRESHIEIALERLEKLKLIQKNADNQWEAMPQANLAFSDVPSLAIRKFHQQILSMHADSLNEDFMEEREHLSTILAIPRHLLPELKEELRKFQIQFWQKIANEPKDDLYSFSIQFCPIKNRRGGERD